MSDALAPSRLLSDLDRSDLVRSDLARSEFESPAGRPPARSEGLPAGFRPMAQFMPAFSIEGTARTPVVFASPHSGRIYPAGFLAASRLDPLTLRRSEDAFVEALFAAAVDHGAPLIHAHFPRAFVDVNREAWELDPAMFDAALPAWCNTRSIKVAGGLGTIARVVADGAEIYRDRLSFAEAEHRIKTLYRPYHRAVARLLDDAAAAHGGALLIDCHSMPSIGGPMDRDWGTNRCDFVLGDRYGTSCAPMVTRLVADTLRGMGYRVTRNAPYAGGYCTTHYGNPAKGVHALQIEINRGLYMDERAMAPLESFVRVAGDLARLVSRLTSLRPQLFCAS